MKILVAWDDPNELDLLQLYLSVDGENEIEVCGSRGELAALAIRPGWDVALLAQTMPTSDDGFSAFMNLRSKNPDLPIVLGARAEEIVGLPLGKACVLHHSRRCATISFPRPLNRP